MRKFRLKEVKGLFSNYTSHKTLRCRSLARCVWLQSCLLHFQPIPPWPIIMSKEPPYPAPTASICCPIKLHTTAAVQVIKASILICSLGATLPLSFWEGYRILYMHQGYGIKVLGHGIRSQGHWYGLIYCLTSGESVHWTELALIFQQQNRYLLSTLECSRNYENYLQILGSLNIHVHIHMLKPREGGSMWCSVFTRDDLLRTARAPLSIPLSQCPGPWSIHPSLWKATW